MGKQIDLRSTEMNEVVKEVREMRMKISEKCGHDLNRLIAYYQEVGKRLRKTGKYKFVDPESSTEKSKSTKSSDHKAAD
ncbi:hypothetical protein C6500_00930 [Candidatus Poribacteria bacterium]|nr:MAG: hypothetical protein C6500_00930 [Candidatus Poribacteria bacterium]